MKRTTILLSILFLLISSGVLSQTKPKQKPPSHAEINKMMENTMKESGMSKEEQEEMKKMMKDMMPALTKSNIKIVNYPEFTDNKQLIPKRDAARINAISKKALTDADVTATSANLYNKLMQKATADEKAIISKVIAKEKTGSSLMSAAVVAFLQGHNQVAMGLAMKAVMADPKNANYQNNLAAILSQSGYPEKAIPFLKKLQQQLPGNSTINNNLGFAWLKLGEVDSAKRFYAMAAIRNPANPETKLCGGVLKELEGDPIEAVRDYVDAFEEIPNPFAESMINNRKAGDRIDKMDFEKLKQHITIHEFFTKEWTTLPQLSNSVNGFNSDQSIMYGYDMMYGKLDKKLEELQEAAGADLNALYDKGEDEFVKTMLKESMEGVNMMSKPAAYITKMLGIYFQEMTQKYMQELAKLDKFIDEQREIKNKSGENDKCPDYDRRSNAYMEAVNPRIKEFYQKYLDDYRTWLNAWCTWRWYLTGNIRNTVLTEYINWTRGLLSLHQEAVDKLEFDKPACVPQKENSPANIADLPIPSFLCPVVVTMPVGLEALRLSAEAAALDNNSFGIKHSGGAMPNATISFGVGKGTITEPGLYGTPYVKTANGSINQSGFNYTENSGDFDKSPSREFTSEELNRLIEGELNLKNIEKMVQQAKLTRQLLNKMMTADCSDKNKKFKFTVRLGDIEFEDEPNFTVTLGEIEFEDELEFTVTLGEIEFGDEPTDTEGAGDSGIKDLVTNGIQTTINNGLEAAGTMVNFIRGLFD
ncbi:MAG: hypothetical protein LC128_06545 [Chitinophagales bacterium]|nr:hypothetical protein [Chitinophagales bacterium]